MKFRFKDSPTLEQPTELETLQKEEVKLKNDINERIGEGIETLEPTVLSKVLDVAQEYGQLIITAGIAIAGIVTIVETFVNGRPQLDVPLNADGWKIVISAFAVLFGGGGAVSKAKIELPRSGFNG